MPLTLIRRISLLLIVACFATGCATTPRPPEAREYDLSDRFGELDGCFVMLNVKTGDTYRHNPPRCAERYSPCSTFKVPHALIALQTDVLTGPDHLLPWDGQMRHRNALNRDHTLQTAIADSVVWYFQRVAELIGEERMGRFLDLLQYGNRDISGGLTGFWLGSTLAISAEEQVEFLRRLHAGELPCRAGHMRAVREMIVLERRPDAVVLRGKTGTAGDAHGRATLGWFVGSVETRDNTFIFATNISGARDAGGQRAREVTLQILHDFQLWQAGTTARAQ